MSHRTNAEVILDSITPHGDATRLTSMYVVFPKMILGERNRHRAFSLSDRSSRAVPPEKLIEEVRNDPAMPAKFRRRVKGMGGGEDLLGAELHVARQDWAMAAAQAATYTHILSEGHGLAKEIANRPLDPFIRMHSLMTATRDGWLNFFGLRLDEAADPTIQVLAQRCYEAYRASTPKLLQPSEWHLPFVDDQELGDAGCYSQEDFVVILPILKKISAARCAHLSYNDLETGKRMTIERALSIYERLANSRPLHASPMEHQATPDEWIQSLEDNYSQGWWRNPEQHGNLPGWRQARKMLRNEAVASLPKGYDL